jgi:hypothetical protein
MIDALMPSAESRLPLNKQSSRSRTWRVALSGARSRVRVLIQVLVMKVCFYFIFFAMRLHQDSWRECIDIDSASHTLTIKREVRMQGKKGMARGIVAVSLSSTRPE